MDIPLHLSLLSYLSSGKAMRKKGEAVPFRKRGKRESCKGIYSRGRKRQLRCPSKNTDGTKEKRRSVWTPEFPSPHTLHSEAFLVLRRNETESDEPELAFNEEEEKKNSQKGISPYSKEDQEQREKNREETNNVRSVPGNGRKKGGKEPSPASSVRPYRPAERDKKGKEREKDRSGDT